MSTTSIDDVLATAHLPPAERVYKPEAPEEKYNAPVQHSDSVDISSEPVKKIEKNEHVDLLQPKIEVKNGEEKQQKNEESSKHIEETHDEYGNEKPIQSKKMYTEDEVNERINRTVRERLERLERNNPQLQQQSQVQAQPNVQQHNNAQEDWQQQLESFVRQTNEKVRQEEFIRYQQQQEQRAHQEFQDRFHQGMSKFPDFVEVVRGQPVTDAMTVATRSMKDPAAFLYAAAKRHPQELERISKIPDAYAQIAEMGRLEERMKKTQSATKAPRPINPTREDGHIASEPTVREPTIEDLMRAEDAKRMSRMRPGRR